MAMRRYKIGEYPVYDKRFEARKSQSQILNPLNFGVSETAMQMGDKHGIELLLIERIGTEDGKTYFDPSSFDGSREVAKIPRYTQRLKEIEDEFVRFKQGVINSGRRPPTEMPSDMMEKYLETQAELDVVQGEAEKLQKLLEAIKDGEIKIDNERVLEYGPVGSGSLKGGILAEVDGQKVGKDKRGKLLIQDPRSPYDGMSTPDYFDYVVKPFPKVRNGLCLRPIKKENLPPWPDNIPKPNGK